MKAYYSLRIEGRVSWAPEPRVSIRAANGDITRSADELTQREARFIVSWLPRGGTIFGENRKTCVRDARYEAVAIGSSKRSGVRSPPDSGALAHKKRSPQRALAVLPWWACSVPAFAGANVDEPSSPGEA